MSDSELEAKILSLINEYGFAKVENVVSAVGRTQRQIRGSRTSLENPIEALDLSVRVFNAFKRAGYLTIEDMIMFVNTPDANIRGVGTNALMEVLTKLTPYLPKDDETPSEGLSGVV